MTQTLLTLKKNPPKNSQKQELCILLVTRQLIHKNKTIRNKYLYKAYKQYERLNRKKNQV